MVERTYENDIKVYVSVEVRFDEGGNMRPLCIIWEDGRKFEIESVLDVRRAASLKAGGNGIRFKCRIDSKETYLFYEQPRWFVERAKPAAIGQEG
jgi:hypothetical protein